MMGILWTFLILIKKCEKIMIAICKEIIKLNYLKNSYPQRETRIVVFWNNSNVSV